MKFGNFTAEVGDENKLTIPPEVRRSLKLAPGDRVEISLKKVKSGKLSLLFSTNPLYKLLDLNSAQNMDDDR